MLKIIEYFSAFKRNKHTTAAGVVCILIGVFSAAWPEREILWKAIFKAAVGYGFLMSMDSPPETPSKKALTRPERGGSIGPKTKIKPIMKIKTLAVFGLLFLYSIGLAFAQTNSLAQIVVTQPPDSNLNELLQLLGPHFAFLIPIFAWLFAFSTIMKVVAPAIQRWASAKVADNVETPGSDHDIALRAILSSSIYRILAVTLDLIFSINLPTLNSYLKQLEAANPGAVIDHPDGSVSAAPEVKPTSVSEKVSDAASNKMKLSLVFLLLIPALMFSGCGGGKLSPTGVYGSGAVFGTNQFGQPVSTNILDGALLFQADQAIVNGAALLDGFVLFAYQNQVALAPFPQIQIMANTLRAKSPEYVNAVIAARDAYQKNPIDATKSALQSALSVISAAISNASDYRNQATQYIISHPPAPQIATPAPTVVAPALPPPAVTAPPATVTNAPVENSLQKINPK